MTQRNRTPRRSSVRDAETGSGARQVPARPHDWGSQANETVLDATTESLRHAPEDTPSGTGPGNIEKTPVFDRAGAAPKILMARKQKDQIVETPNEARQAEPGPSVLALLTVSAGLASMILASVWYVFFRT
jgi:hypothetical protein